MTPFVAGFGRPRGWSLRRHVVASRGYRRRLGWLSLKLGVPRDRLGLEHRLKARYALDALSFIGYDRSVLAGLLPSLRDTTVRGGVAEHDGLITRRTGAAPAIATRAP